MCGSRNLLLVVSFNDAVCAVDLDLSGLGLAG
jgi:hypothetical protein